MQFELEIQNRKQIRKDNYKKGNRNKKKKNRQTCALGSKPPRRPISQPHRATQVFHRRPTRVALTDSAGSLIPSSTGHT